MSAAAIIRPFGSQEGLRRACDTQVLDFIGPHRIEAMESLNPGEVVFSQLVGMEEFEPCVRYGMWSFLTGGDVAHELMEHMCEHTRVWIDRGVAAGSIKPSRDEDLRDRLLIRISIGWLMQSLLVSGKGLGDFRTVDFSAIFLDMLVPSLELCTQGLFTSPTIYETYLSDISDPPADDRTAGKPAGGEPIVN